MARPLKWNKPTAEVWRSWGIVPPETEVEFHPTRRWRLDFAWPQVKVAVEVHGGRWSGGAHVRPRGVKRDWDKATAAQALGWIVLAFAPEEVFAADALRVIRQSLELRGLTLKP